MKVERELRNGPARGRFGSPQRRCEPSIAHVSVSSNSRESGPTLPAPVNFPKLSNFDQTMICLTGRLYLPV
jgi:hypothetical protein